MSRQSSARVIQALALKDCQADLARVTTERDAATKMLAEVMAHANEWPHWNHKFLWLANLRVIMAGFSPDTGTVAQPQSDTGVQRERDALRNKLDAALAMLRELEWHGVEYDDGAADHCPVCRNIRREGHAPDCALAALLEGAGE